MIPVEVLILIAFLIDLLVGDPPALPHPVRLIGRLALLVEKFFREFFTNQSLAGGMSVLSVLALTGWAAFSLIKTAEAIHPWLGSIVELYLLYSAFAVRDLARHSKDVYLALAAGDLGLARQQVAMIVGRDTENLDEQGVCRACVESVAENIVDGITAPLFWAAVAGPIGAVLYKAVNTMDSMFGYKNERFYQFGTAAARLDDLANYLPARLTAVLVVAASLILRLDYKNSWSIWRRDRRCHASPNSGQSEAAVAGALGVRLGGPASYFGERREKPYIGGPGDQIKLKHILAVNRIMFTAASLAALLLFAVRFSVNIR